MVVVTRVEERAGDGDWVLNCVVAVQRSGLSVFLELDSVCKGRTVLA